jgi:hypothetical protein
MRIGIARIIPVSSLSHKVAGQLQIVYDDF